MPELTELIGMDNWCKIRPIAFKQHQEFQRVNEGDDKSFKAYCPALDFDADEQNTAPVT